LLAAARACFTASALFAAALSSTVAVSLAAAAAGCAAGCDGSAARRPNVFGAHAPYPGLTLGSRDAGAGRDATWDHHASRKRQITLPSSPHASRARKIGHHVHCWLCCTVIAATTSRWSSEPTSAGFCGASSPASSSALLLRARMAAALAADRGSALLASCRMQHSFCSTTGPVQHQHG